MSSSKSLLTKAIFDTIAKHLNMTEFGAIKHLVEFDATQPKRVLLVDDCETCFSLTLVCSEGMRTFLECVNAGAPTCIGSSPFTVLPGII